MPPTGAPSLTIAAGAREGTLAITGCSVLALLIPRKLDGQFLKVATSKDGGTTYFNQTMEVQGQTVVRHIIPKSDEIDDANGYVAVLGWPAVYDYIKVICSSRQKYARTFYVLLEGSEGGSGSLTLDLGDAGTSTSIGSGTPGTLTDTSKAWTTNEWAGAVVTAGGKTITVASNTATVLTGTAAWSTSAPTSPVAYTLYFSYPIAQIRRVSSMADALPALRMGKVQYDQYNGCWRFRIDDFSGPAGQVNMDLDAPRQGHRWHRTYPGLDGAMGYLVPAPARTERITPSPAINTTRIITPTSIAISSVIFDEDNDPCVFAAVGNEVWRSGIGNLDFQVDLSANAAASTTDTTLTDTRAEFTTNQWVGFVVTCNSKTMTVTSNTATVLTGTGGWSGGGNPGNGKAWEMHCSLGALASATQITSIIETRDGTGGRRLYVSGAAQSADIEVYYSSTGAVNSLATTDVDGEAICLVQGVRADTKSSPFNKHDAVLGASRNGTVWAASPLDAGALKLSSKTTIRLLPGRVQWLASRFDDPTGLGAWCISGGRLFNIVWSTQGSLLSELRSVPELQGVTCGCMWQRRPTVARGLEVWTVRGDEVERISIPASVLETATGDTVNYRPQIQSLSAAGALLIAGVKLADGDTKGHEAWAVYDEDSGQWRKWAGSYTESQPNTVCLGAHAVNTKTIGERGEQHLLISALVNAGNSILKSLAMPGGLVGQPGTDDTFQNSCYSVLPSFVGLRPGTEKTLIRISQELELWGASQPAMQLYLDGTALGRVIHLAGGEDYHHVDVDDFSSGKTFDVLDIVLDSTGNPLWRALEIWWKERIPTRLIWEVLLDTQKWMRDNSKVMSQLLTELARHRDDTTLPQAAITNIMTAARVDVSHFEVENPSDPSTAPIGYTLVRLEEPV